MKKEKAFFSASAAHFQTRMCSLHPLRKRQLKCYDGSGFFAFASGALLQKRLSIIHKLLNSSTLEDNGCALTKLFLMPSNFDL
jgi:hypothetical protein